jgi:hypothetical protein
MRQLYYAYFFVVGLCRLLRRSDGMKELAFAIFLEGLYQSIVEDHYLEDSTRLRAVFVETYQRTIQLWKMA